MTETNFVSMPDVPLDMIVYSKTEAAIFNKEQVRGLVEIKEMTLS